MNIAIWAGMNTVICLHYNLDIEVDDSALRVRTENSKNVHYGHDIKYKYYAPRA